MNILITVSYYSPHISGLTNSIKNLAEGLAEKGHRVAVLTTRHVHNLALDEVINTVHVERVSYLLKLQKGFIMPFYFIPLVRQVFQSNCVVINLPQPEGVLAAFFGRIFGKRVISVYACEVSLPKSVISSFIEQVLTFSHYLTLSMSHNVVALSDDYAKHTKLLRLFKEKTVAIYPYIQKLNVIARHEAIQSKTRLPRSFFARNDKQLRIGYLGRISAEKGLEYLLNTVPFLQKHLGKNFRIIIAGPNAVGEQTYVEKIEQLAEKFKDHVEIVPPLADDEMGTFYTSLDVLVLPSINSTEAFGMVQVEAMFCGTPVVCSDLPGVRVPILETGMGEIAKKKNTEDLAQKIMKVLKHKEEYVKKRKVAEEVFDSGKVVENYERLLK